VRESPSTDPAEVVRRPAPRSQIIYVPIEIAEEPRGGLGCLPLIVAAILIVLALLALGGMPN